MRLSQTLRVLASALLVAQVALALRTNFPIVNKEIAPDGFQRSAVLAAGTFPGPTLKGFKGDNFQINVLNQLQDNSMLRSTSIHWHGFFQAGSAWADGPAFVTQCPIAANHSFLYDFNVPDQAGTFWYHSHLGAQYCDGLRGAFVVYDRFDPHRGMYDVDDESTVITLADWYHTPSPAAGPVPVSDATLINGLGRYASGPASPLAVVNVRHGKRYRFRLVSISCDPNFTFSIDGHSMTIIEVDGVNTEPLSVDSVQIFAGQRYSVVVEANQPVGSYWMRAKPNLGNTTFVNNINSAILRYDGAPNAEPTTALSPSTHPFNEVNLHPLVNGRAPGNPHPGGADINLNLALDFNFTSFQFTINGASFVPPTVPVLLQILSGAKAPHQLLPPGSVIPLERNKVVEISFPANKVAGVGGPHPFHLHGHTFSVVRSAGSNDYNYENPVQRDVVSTGGANDNVTIRFKTDNAGPWFLHCHIDWHLDAGFAAVMAEDVPHIPGDITPPAAWKDLCPIYDQLTPDQL